MRRKRETETEKAGGKEGKRPISYYYAHYDYQIIRPGLQLCLVGFTACQILVWTILGFSNIEFELAPTAGYNIGRCP